MASGEALARLPAGADAAGAGAASRRGLSFRGFIARCLLRLGCGSLCGAGALRALAFAQDKRHFLSYLRNTSIPDEDFLEHPFVESLHFHGSLVGFDIGEDVSHLDLVTLFFLPARDGPLNHCVA